MPAIPLAALLLAAGALTLPAAPCERVLRQGAATAEAVTGDAPLEYCLELDDGAFALVAASTRGLGVTGELRDPAGELLEGARFIDALGGEFELAAVASGAGTYRLLIEPALLGPGPHTLELLLLELRPSRPPDIARVEAQGLLAESWSLQSDGSGDSLRRAAELLSRSLPIWRNAGSVVWEGRMLYHLGWVRYLLGQSRVSLETLEQALALQRGSGDSAWEGLTLSAIGQVQVRSGAIQEGIDALERALEIHRFAGLRAQEANDLVNLGEAYRRVGEGERADQGYTLALQILRDLGDRSSESVVLNDLGVHAWEQRDHDRALRYYEQALAIQRELGLKRFEAESLHNIGRVYADRGDFEQALGTFRQAAALDEATGDRSGLASVLNRAGFCAIKLGRPQEAVATLRRAVDLAREVGEPLVEAGGHVNLARAYRDLGQPAAAREEVERTLRLVDAERADLRDPERRATFLAKWRGFYEICIGLLVTLDTKFPGQGLLEAAFAVSERARARSLLELLAEARIEEGTALDPERARREGEAAQRLASVQTRLLTARMEGAGEPVLQRLEAELTDAENARARLEEEGRRLDPRAASLRRPQPVSLAEIRSRLAADAAFLEYSFGAKSGSLFVVTRSSLRAYPLPSVEEVGRNVEALLAATERPGRRGWGEYTTAARRLFEQLVEPAAAQLGDRSSLVIAADGPLHHLPFEALLTAASDPSLGESDQPYLVRRWTVSYVPSGSVLVALGLGAPRRSEGADGQPRPLLAAFGDPGFGGTDEAAVAADGGLPGALRSVFADADQWRFPRLEFSRQEVLDVASYYPRERTGLFLGDAATEDAVKRDPAVSAARCLHFATHALVSDSLPAHSALVLRLDQDPAEDGLLQAFEVYRLKLAAELVVLSACETARGKEVSGEGPLGLARAFLYAGAHSVVASHWAVADRSTAELMTAFHRRLAAGTPAARALQQAKLDLLEREPLAHPYFWAPFVLMGAPGSPEPAR